MQDSEQRKLDSHSFNEAYLTHTFTSPQYAIIVEKTGLADETSRRSRYFVDCVAQ